MPPGWLSLKVARRPEQTRPEVFISIPKKAVPLAVKRNRLKRLIREAVRGDDFFKAPGQVYVLRAGAFPGPVKLDAVKRTIAELKEGPA